MSQQLEKPYSSILINQDKETLPDCGTPLGF